MAASLLAVWLAAHADLAYGVIFLVALVESLAVVGLLVPGILIMLAAGALIDAGVLGFWPAYVAAFAGGAGGAALSYWYGRHYRHHVRLLWPFRNYGRQIEQGVAFCTRYGTYGVIASRFFGPGRALIPLVAGMLEMRPHQFLLANFGATAAWAPVYLALGNLLASPLAATWS